MVKTMPRKPRLFVSGLPAHIVQRGNNRQPIFFEESDFRLYLSLLAEARDRYGCAVHTYVLMTNHVHLLMTPEERSSISCVMQYIGRQYVPYVNSKYGRSGTLWEGRFRASTVETSNYLLACYRYIEMNPVRAGIAGHAAEYSWSGYRHNALGQFNGLITPHGEYLALGKTLDSRVKSYRRLFDCPMSENQLREIRDFLQSGTPLGNKRFSEEIESTLTARVGYVRRGRPRIEPEKGL
jgi:putative transposase